MRILLLNQFYPPDVAPTGRFLQDLARCLTARGHAVTVVCSRRSYEGGRRYPAAERMDGAEVRRVAGFGFGRRSSVGKAMDCLAFYAMAAVRLFRRGQGVDLVLSLSTPPFLGLVARVSPGLRGARRAHWVMDLYPEVMAAHGMVRAGGMRERMLTALSRMELAGSSLVVCPGPEMAETLRRRTGGGARPGPSVEWVPLWAAEGLSPWPARTPNPCRDERGWGREELVLLYSGNLGLGHRFGEFLTAAERLSGSGGLRWVFAGSGRRRGEVERFRREHPGAPVDLLPYAPWNRLREHLCSGDVHLASLDGRWARHMVPSKVQSVLAVGRPLIFVGPPDSVSGRWIAESGAGWVVPEGDVGGVLRAVQEARDPLARERRGMAARAYAERHFDLGANCTRIAGMLEHAAGGGGGGR